MKLPNGQPLRWDTPGARWDGTVEEVIAALQPTTSNSTNMAQNLISLNISAADLTEIDAALTTLETKLAPLIGLTPEQRRELVKMGDKSEPFVREVLIIARQNVSQLPPAHAGDLPEAESDLADFDTLRPRIARLTTLAERGADTQLAIGSDLMTFGLAIYGILKFLGVGASLDTLRAGLGARFAGRRKQPATDGGTTPA